MLKKNLDKETVNSFGDEWSRFNQSRLNVLEAEKIFAEYFKIFNWSKVSKDSVGFDMGCGSGRWAYLVSPKVRHLNCIDASESAIAIAQNKLKDYKNITYIISTVEDTGLIKGSQDFGYSLGVLHHLPDTFKAIASCVELLRPGGQLLLYLYYNFENKGYYYKIIWKITNYLRLIISKFPYKIRNIFTDFFAVFFYFPLAKISLFFEKIGLEINSIPLSYYRNHSFYTMRTDSRDRFGTPLEKRFSRKEIELMMIKAGLINIRFSDSAPFWCACGEKNG